MLGCGALKLLEHGEAGTMQGEIKSMRTAAHARGRGIGALLLTHILAEARHMGYHRLYLETGSQDFFAPARRLYQRHGFDFCPPFAGYGDDPNSSFMTLALDPHPALGPSPPAGPQLRPANSSTSLRDASARGCPEMALAFVPDEGAVRDQPGRFLGDLAGKELVGASADQQHGPPDEREHRPGIEGHFALHLGEDILRGEIGSAQQPAADRRDRSAAAATSGAGPAAGTRRRPSRRRLCHRRRGPWPSGNRRPCPSRSAPRR